ncbi:MAG TPA: VOC family protein [Chloroflexota bacterium]|jgi:catechol 2,3-dioxygenase-like lactoylglutathione lyase family enzyme
MMKIDGVTHWSIPVNDLAEAEAFYRDVLGLEYRGRLGNSNMACVRAGDHEILLTEREDKIRRTPDQDGRTHHSFTMQPDAWVEGVKVLADQGVEILDLMYREQGFFTGRELYFLDPSGNVLELRDPTWKTGMPKPSIDEIVGKAAASK